MQLKKQPEQPIGALQQAIMDNFSGNQYKVANEDDGQLNIMIEPTKENARTLFPKKEKKKTIEPKKQEKPPIQPNRPGTAKKQPSLVSSKSQRKIDNAAAKETNQQNAARARVHDHRNSKVTSTTRLQSVKRSESLGKQRPQTAKLPERPKSSRTTESNAKVSKNLESTQK